MPNRALVLVWVVDKRTKTRWWREGIQRKLSCIWIYFIPGCDSTDSAVLVVRWEAIQYRHGAKQNTVPFKTSQCTSHEKKHVCVFFFIYIYNTPACIAIVNEMLGCALAKEIAKVPCWMMLCAYWTFCRHKLWDIAYLHLCVKNSEWNIKSYCSRERSSGCCAARCWPVCISCERNLKYFWTGITII